MSGATNRAAYKIFHLLVPGEGVDDAGFRAAWDARASQLAEAAEAAPGLQYYVRTPRSERSASLAEFHGHDYEYEGVEVLAFATAGQALAFKSTVATLATEFLDPSSETVVVREHVLINGGPLGAGDSGPGIKVITSLRRVPELTLDDFFHRWLTVHGQYVVETQGISRYIQNHVITEEYANGTPRYDGFVEVWHRTLADQQVTFADPMMTEVQAADIPQFIDTGSFFSIQCTDDEQWVVGARPHLSIKD